MFPHIRKLVIREVTKNLTFPGNHVIFNRLKTFQTLGFRVKMGKSGDYVHLWSSMGSYSDNPMGLHWLGIILGLAWVISFGYWTTDFLVVQRVFAAKDLRSARMAPVIASFFKMAIPFVVIVPGLIGIVVLPELKPADSGAFNCRSTGRKRPT